MSEDYYPKFERLTLNQKETEVYTSQNSLASCFCSGACTELGYCPAVKASEINESASDKARRLGTKVIPDIPPKKPENPIVGVCERCSRTIYLSNEFQMCMDVDCPCGIGGVKYC